MFSGGVKDRSIKNEVKITPTFMVTIKRLLSYMKQSTLLVVLSIIVAVIGTIMHVMSPKILGKATTLIFDGINSDGGINFNKLSMILLIAIVMYLGVFITTFLQKRIMVIVSQKTTYELRNDLKNKMNNVPISFFDKNSNGNLMSIAINDIENIVTTLQQSITDLISSIITIVGVIIIMFWISPMLTLISLIMVPATLMIMKLLTPKTQSNNINYLSKLGKLNSQIEESYNGFAIIKSFNYEKQAIENFIKTNDEMFESGWRSKLYGGMMMPLMMLIENTLYIVLAVIGALKVIGKTLVIGDLQAFLQYSKLFSQPLMQLSQIWNNILSTIASANRVFEILDASEVDNCEKTYSVNDNEKGKVIFDDVKFSYGNDTLFEHFNLEVSQGEMIAIVGHTGAGKSTLINLIERFYDIQAGTIRINGYDISQLDFQDLRKQIAMVLQDTWLFSGTIFDNIKYGNEVATDKQIYAAAKAAYADEFIKKLPNGYDTILGEDSTNISQGQKQLITIARAFVLNPEILILDEATSNVDSRTELIIQRAMKKLLKGRTSFVVAHRLSTIYDANRIIVMDNGDIIETGTHNELLDGNGMYADIYNSQFIMVT